MDSEKGAQRALLAATVCLLGLLGLFRGLFDGGRSAAFLFGYSLSYIVTGLVGAYLIFGWTSKTRRYVPALMTAIAALHVVAMITRMTPSATAPGDSRADAPTTADSIQPLGTAEEYGDTIREFVRRRLAQLDSAVESERPRYVAVDLPNGVVIELPEDWVVFSDSARVALRQYVQTSLARRGMSDRSNSDLAFAANWYDSEGETAGIANVHYYIMPVGQRFLQVLDEDLLSSIGKDMEAEFRRAAPADREVLEWVNTERVIVNGLYALSAEYRRASPNRPAFRVRVLRVYDEARSFSLTASYREDYAAQLESVTDHLIATLRRIDNH